MEQAPNTPIPGDHKESIILEALKKEIAESKKAVSENENFDAYKTTYNDATIPIDHEQAQKYASIENTIDKTNDLVTRTQELEDQNTDH